jgi:GNAT superfamily N-acetyltransferase
MSFAIRAAVEGDVLRLVAMYEWLFDGPGARPPTWQQRTAGARLGEAILGQTSAILVAEEGAELIGLCSAYLDLTSVRYGPRCWVEDLAVDPRKRSTGVGRALLDAAKDWARERGATHLELDTGLARVDAQRFYEREQPVAVGYCYSWRL